MNQRFIEAYQVIMKNPNAPSKKVFCDQIGVSYSNWSKYEKGERPFDLASIVAMTNQYNVSSDYLLFGTGEIFLNTTKPTQQTGIGKNTGSNISNIQASGNVHIHTMEECRRELATANGTIDTLRSQLQDKERIIQLLEMQLKK